MHFGVDAMLAGNGHAGGIVEDSTETRRRSRREGDPVSLQTGMALNGGKTRNRHVTGQRLSTTPTSPSKYGLSWLYRT